MATLARGPYLLKGAIVAIDPHAPLPRVIVFQYNPNTLTRELQARVASGDDGARAEALRLSGAPVETIALEVEIDATDQLEQKDVMAIGMGIYPQLSALEMLIYPATSLVLANMGLAALGTIELIGAQMPLTLFIWGMNRVVPVRIGGLRIVEEAYDARLNPIRARVGLSLRVLTYSDLLQNDPGYSLFLTHQIVKETMAALGSVGSLSNMLGGAASLF